ncbi:MAG: hypothetical protein FWC70_11840, partial [Defluviitaleaceae bacterium]|nr:hypothetical protein [Defluviitaleaceae bacterium]
MSSNEKITMRQLQVMLIISAMGTGAVVLPRRAAEFLPVQNVWVIAVGAAIAAVVVGVLISAAARAARDAYDFRDNSRDNRDLGDSVPNPLQGGNAPLTPTEKPREARFLNKSFDGGSGETFSKVSPENVSFIAT